MYTFCCLYLVDIFFPISYTRIVEFFLMIGTCTCACFVLFMLQGRGLRILEALAATGLRSIRYALEIPRAASIVANDISPDAFEAMKRNIEQNNVVDKVIPSCQDAR